MANLDRQVPKNHPQRKAYEQQVKSQLPSYDQMVKQITDQLTQPEQEHFVPLTLREAFLGSESYTYPFPRLTICRGCRASPEAPACAGCGRCPPTTLTKQKRTMFGYVAGKTVKIESQERCREVPTAIEGLRIPRGVQEGAYLKRVAIGHQTPGRIQGRTVFKASVAKDPQYAVSGLDLYCVLDVTLEEALQGFQRTWQHFDDTPVVVKRGPVQPWDVVRLPSKGLVDARGKKRGDMYVRLNVLLSGAATEGVRREHEVEVRDGRIWRRWREVEQVQREKTLHMGKSEL